VPVRNPLVGYNDNLEHRGQIYHVQTEDSGVRRPNLITHLFADGGRIVTSTKTSYAELVDQPDQETKVRQLMRSQHLGMIEALRNGEIDHLLGVPAKASVRTTRAATGTSSAAGAPVVVAEAASPSPTPAAGAAPTAGLPPAAEAGPKQTPEPPRVSAAAQAAEDAFERAAATAEEQFLSGMKPTAPRPAMAADGARKATPPAAGSYRYVGKRASELPGPPVSSPASLPPRRRRYVATNPGRLRADERGAWVERDGEAPTGEAGPPSADRIPLPAGFGARFITERSLDEVMLEFLAKVYRR
jgi:hypothetical protein